MTELEEFRESRTLPEGHVLRWSAWEIRAGEQRARPLRARDTWQCPKCRHVYRRERKTCPIRYEGYATAGEYRRDLACETCVKRLALLHPETKPAKGRPAADVGRRIPGVDAG